VAHGAPSRRLAGLTGEFEAVRPEYRCRPRSAHQVPADRLIGLGRGLLSPALSRVVAPSSAEIPPFECAAHTVPDALGITLEAMTVERTVEALGYVAEREIQTKMAALEPVESVAHSADAPAAAPVLSDDAPAVLVGADGELWPPPTQDADGAREGGPSTAAPTRPGACQPHGPEVLQPSRSVRCAVNTAQASVTRARATMATIPRTTWEPFPVVESSARIAPNT
jgi:hypothetical protein